MSGAIEKHIYVKTNDPRNREAILTVRGIVEPEIELSDYGIFFGSAPRGKEVRREILLTIPAGRYVRPLGAETTDRRIAVNLEPVTGSNSQKWRLIAVRKADVKPGDLYGEIRIKTSSRLTPMITIYAHGTIQ